MEEVGGGGGQGVQGGDGQGVQRSRQLGRIYFVALNMNIKINPVFYIKGNVCI